MRLNIAQCRWEEVDVGEEEPTNNYIKLHCVSKKVPTFKLHLPLSNLNQLSKFLHCWKVHEIATKPV